MTSVAQDNHFPASCRIRKHYEYQLLFRSGRRIALPHFVIYYQVRVVGPSRLGLTVSRKVGGAVVRNRCKRYLREIFRRLQSHLAMPLDISVQLRPAAARLSFPELSAEFRKALEQAKLCDSI